MLWVFSGLPGVGKSTLARALAARTGAVWLRIDSLEAGITAVFPGLDLRDAGYRAAHLVASDNLALGRAVVADQVNPIALTRDAWAAVARDGGHSLREVEVVCSDKAAHRARVEARHAAGAGPDWATVRARRWEPWDRPVIRVDTAALDPDAAVAALLA